MRRRILVVDPARCICCKRCELECAVAHSESEDLYEAVRESPGPRARVHVEWVKGYSIPLQCRHCEDAPCVAVCPSGALSRPSPNSPILIDHELCIGCKACIIVCPFGAIRSDETGRATIKCDLCIRRQERGEEPACVRACLTGALRLVEESTLVEEKRKKAAEEYLVVVERGEKSN